MSTILSAQQMLESYLHEVGKRLSSTNRDAILQEIKSDITAKLSIQLTSEDVLPETVTREEMNHVLSDFGDPEVRAHQYSGNPRYLIGPELYETYWMVLVMVSVVGFVGSTFGDFLSGNWVPTTGNIGSKVILHMFGNALEVGIGTVGSVTIVFILIELLLQKKNIFSAKKLPKREWTPSVLKLVQRGKDDIRLQDTIWDIIWVLIGITVLNVGLEQVTVYHFKGTNGIYQSVPFLSKEVIQGYLLWINLLFASALALCFYQLKAKKWHLVTRGIDSIISLMSLLLIGALLTSPDLVISGAFEHISSLASVKGIALEKGVMAGIQTFLSVFVIIECFNIGKHGFRIFGKK